MRLGIDEQAVAVEALDVIAFECGAVAPDVDVVLLHGGDQHGAGDGAADGRGVEVGNASSGDVECAGLERGDAFANQRAAAVDEACLFRAVFEGLARNLVVVGFVGLAEVGRVGVGDGALLLHPVQGGGGVEPAGEGNANLLADGQGFENYGHRLLLRGLKPPHFICRIGTIRASGSCPFNTSNAEQELRLNSVSQRPYGARSSSRHFPRTALRLSWAIFLSPLRG